MIGTRPQIIKAAALQPALRALHAMRPRPAEKANMAEIIVTLDGSQSEPLIGAVDFVTPARGTPSFCRMW